MSTYVHLHLVFHCADGCIDLAGIAQQHLPAMQRLATEQYIPEPAWFLQDLSEGKCHHSGPKGCLVLWGLIGSNTEAEEFVRSLKPFWMEVFRSLGLYYGGSSPPEHVLVFYGQEDDYAGKALEIYASDPADSKDPNTFILVLKKHEHLPFFWRQFEW